MFSYLKGFLYLHLSHINFLNIFHCIVYLITNKKVIQISFTRYRITYRSPSPTLQENARIWVSNIFLFKKTPAFSYHCVSLFITGNCSFVVFRALSVNFCHFSTVEWLYTVQCTLYSTPRTELPTSGMFVETLLQNEPARHSFVQRSRIRIWSTFYRIRGVWRLDIAHRKRKRGNLWNRPLNSATVEIKTWGKKKV